VIVASDNPQLAGHLAHGLALHLQWLQRNGLHPPPELGDLLSALQDRSGQQGTPVAFEPSLLDAQLVDYKNAAAVLGVSVKTVQRMTRDGRLPVERIGARRLVPRSALDELVSGRAP
jgi:excisionase family DNA binding protein